MPKLMRCQYCGLLQDEPAGVKECSRCGGELSFENQTGEDGISYIKVQMELDQVSAPSERNCDRYLLVTLSTPGEVPAAYAAAPRGQRAPLNFCAILDVSGSMQGEKIAKAREAVRQALHHLQNGDTFSLVLFSDKVRCVFEPAKLTAANRQTVESTLKEVQAGGMTALCGGLEMGIQKTLANRQDTNLALLLSDGQANVGETDLEKVGLRSAEARQQGITVSTLGVGDDYNEALMAEVASQGGGRFYHIQNAGQIPAYLTGELGEAATLVARNAILQLSIPPGATIMPLSLAYPAQQGNGQASINIGDLPADTELEIPVRLSLPGQPAGTRMSISGTVSYQTPSNHTLGMELNRVTVRFVEETSFQLRDGVVTPVAERVLSQIKAANVLGVSRAMAKTPAEGARQTQIELERLREYAAKLGEERVEYETNEIQGTFNLMAASPVAAKMHVSRSHRLQRSSKDHSQS
jgi:Ca-activated chloride channel family protein